MDVCKLLRYCKDIWDIAYKDIWDIAYKDILEDKKKVGAYLRILKLPSILELCLK